MSKKWKISIGIALGSLFIMSFLYNQNNHITVTEMSLTSPKLPKSFESSKIVHLSDLHNKRFGKDQRKIIDAIKEIEPEIIVFTGDLIDSRRYDEAPSLALLEALVQIAPTYVVNGNHEWRSGKFPLFERKMKDIGVHVLRNETIKIDKGDAQIYVTGIDDPASEQRADQVVTTENIQKAMIGEAEGSFNLLLAHRPELLSLYSAYPFDVVFSGHAHGGQIRLPFMGGVIAPNQGLWPTYTEGMHTMDNTTMIVSRGLGNSLFPFRIFNRPEIIVLTVHSEK